jgi:hypothetical protein
VSVVFHHNPFVAFDEHDDAGNSDVRGEHTDEKTSLNDSPGESSGNRRCVPIRDEYLPTAVDAARLRVGARPLPLGQWVSERDADSEPTCVMKRSLIERRPSEVIAALGDVDEACDEVAAGVLASIGEAPTDQCGLDALIDAASRVPDDLCILIPDEYGVARLAAGVVCSPNRWRLKEKIGGDMASIHRPVARYDSDLTTPVQAMLARIRPDRPMWRINWGVANHPSLFQPETPPVTPEIFPGDLWFRVEWQTLRRLPVTGAILFTIRTYVEKMSDFMEREYAVVHEIADLINKIPDDVAEYKSIAPYRESLFAYLETR